MNGLKDKYDYLLRKTRQRSLALQLADRLLSTKIKSQNTPKKPCRIWAILTIGGVAFIDLFHRFYPKQSIYGGFDDDFLLRPDSKTIWHTETGSTSREMINALAVNPEHLKEPAPWPPAADVKPYPFDGFYRPPLGGAEHLAPGKLEIV